MNIPEQAALLIIFANVALFRGFNPAAKIPPDITFPDEVGNLTQMGSMAMTTQQQGKIVGTTVVR